jgi:hypothetical protein
MTDSQRQADTLWEPEIPMPDAWYCAGRTKRLVCPPELSETTLGEADALIRRWESAEELDTEPLTVLLWRLFSRASAGER